MSVVAAWAAVLWLVNSVVVLSWPFDAGAWHRLEGSPGHYGDDRYAQDWTRDGAHGPPLRAPISGTVVQAAWTCSGYGRTIVILDDARDIAVRIAHLSSIAVTTGEHVDGGETLIGRVGNSGPRDDCGVATGPMLPHAHIAVYRNIDRNGTSPRPINAVDIGDAHSPYAVPFVLLNRPTIGGGSR